jgi:hypothetical protein
VIGGSLKIISRAAEGEASHEAALHTVHVAQVMLPKLIEVGVWVPVMGHVFRALDVLAFEAERVLGHGRKGRALALLCDKLRPALVAVSIGLRATVAHLAVPPLRRLLRAFARTHELLARYARAREGHTEAEAGVSSVIAKDLAAAEEEMQAAMVGLARYATFVLPAH